MLKILLWIMLIVMSIDLIHTKWKIDKFFVYFLLTFSKIIIWTLCVIFLIQLNN